MLHAEGSNLRRFQAIDELVNLQATMPTLSEDTVNLWIAEQRRFAMENLVKPSLEDTQVLLQIALRQGGYHIIRDT